MLAALLSSFSWRALRHHPWRSAAAVAAVMLGVALGFAVHVINASALGEFSQAMRSVGGQPDLELRATRGHLPESLYGLVAAQPQVALAVLADGAFRISGPDAATAWLGVLAYGLQLYFDFSGYSDMAIGAAKMFGFDFKENF